MRDAIRKLKRLELVEMIYQLRRENLEYRQKCEELDHQLAKTEAMLQTYASHSNDEQLTRMESMLQTLLEKNNRTVEEE